MQMGILGPTNPVSCASCTVLPVTNSTQKGVHEEGSSGLTRPQAVLVSMMGGSLSIAQAYGLWSALWSSGVL